MEIVTLPVGEIAPKDSDCIKLEPLPDGGFRLEGSALIACGDGEEVESVAMIDGGRYDSREQAEAAGMAWAEAHCVRTLYVSTAAERPAGDADGGR